MKHVEDVETIELPEGFARELTAGAPSVAVLIERVGGGSRGSPIDVDGRPPRRASTTAFPVGEGYVLQCTDAAGRTTFVGLRGEQLGAYVEAVRADDDWTVLSIEEEGAGARRSRPAGKSTGGQ